MLAIDGEPVLGAGPAFGAVSGLSDGAAGITDVALTVADNCAIRGNFLSIERVVRVLVPGCLGDGVAVDPARDLERVMRTPEELLLNERQTNEWYTKLQLGDYYLKKDKKG